MKYQTFISLENISDKLDIIILTFCIYIYLVFQNINLYILINFYIEHVIKYNIYTDFKLLKNDFDNCTWRLSSLSEIT